MFGKNKEQSSVTLINDQNVKTIPAEFYAGANPIIKFRNVEKEVVLNKNTIKPAEKVLLDKATAAGGAQPMHPANLFTRPKFLVWGAIFLFSLFLVSAGIYYWWQSRSATSTISVKTPVTNVAEVSTTTEPIVQQVVTEPITTPINESTSTLAANIEVLINFPSKLLADSVDLDGDDLTDMLEEDLGTDPAVPDADSDGYSDGHEMYNLYNPAGKEPEKIIDSGLVTEYTNPIFGYKLYYPKNWAVGNVDSEYRDVLFSTLTGENIEVRVFDLEAGQTFAEWFGKNASGEQYADLLAFSGVFEQNGQRRSDYLTYYFSDGQKVIVLVYHPSDSSVINYRAVIKMMARSFRLGI